MLPSLQAAVEKGDWAGAETLANALTLQGIVAKVRPKLEEMAVSALLFGAHRVTKDVKATAFMNGRALPPELQNALNQLEHAIKSDAADAIRKKLHAAIAGMKRADPRAHMKHDIYTEPDKRPDAQSAEEFPPEPDESGATMRRREKDAQAGRWSKGDLSGAELAEHGGLLEPEQAETNFDQTKKVHAAGVMFRTPDGKVLFLRRAPKGGDAGGTWAFPGGKVEPGETHQEAVSRECDEEIGVSPSPKRLKLEHVGSNGYRTFSTDADEEFTPRLNHEHTDYVWAHPIQAPEPLHPGVRETLGRGFLRKAEMSLADQLNAVIQKGAKPPIDLAASLTTSRLVTLGFLTQAQNDGHTQYQVDEVLDERTCPVCVLMNGKTFDVAQQYSRTIQCLSASDPMDLKALAPWPDLEDVQGLDEDALQAGGYGAPPYHAGCRGVLSLAGEVETDDETPILQAGVDDDGGAEPDSAAEPTGESDWTDDDVQQLGWDRFEVTDPENFAAVDEAFAAGDYDQAQALIDKWKADNVQEEDEFEGPNQPKKKRKLQTPAGQLAMDHDDIASDSSSIAFDHGMMNEMNAPIDRV